MCKVAQINWAIGHGSQSPKKLILPGVYELHCYTKASVVRRLLQAGGTRR